VARLRHMIEQQKALQDSANLPKLSGLPATQSHLLPGYADLSPVGLGEGIDTGLPRFMVVFTPDGGYRLVPLDRRELLTGGAVTAISTSATTGQAMTSLNIEHMDPQALLEHFRTLRKTLGALDDIFGSRRVISTVGEQLGLLTELCKNARGQLRIDLLKTGASYAEFASLHCSDMGNIQAATYWIDRAMEWAIEADDRNTVGYVLRRKSFQAAGARDAGRTIGLAQAAQRENPLTARVRALACLQEARGHALDRNEAACQRKIDEADELITDGAHRDDIESDLGYFCTKVHVEVHQAACWTELGHPQRAIGLFHQGLNALPVTNYCNRGEYLSWQAHAHIANNDPEQAVAVGQQSLAIVLATGYNRAKNELQRLAAKLASWAELPAVRDFTQQLATL